MSTARRILIVDDEVDVANILKDLLSVFDYDVAVCYDSTAAVEMALQYKPHVAFVDIGMPRADGFQVIASLRSHPATRCLRAVAHSAWGDAATVSKALASGFDAHATKPVRLERLLELASEEYWADRSAS